MTVKETLIHTHQLNSFSKHDLVNIAEITKQRVVDEIEYSRFQVESYN